MAQVAVGRFARAPLAVELILDVQKLCKRWRRRDGARAQGPTERASEMCFPYIVAKAAARGFYEQLRAMQSFETRQYIGHSKSPLG